MAFKEYGNYNGVGLTVPPHMMFAGRFGNEATLFRLARQLDQGRRWTPALPPMAHKWPKLGRIRG